MALTLLNLPQPDPQPERKATSDLQPRNWSDVAAMQDFFLTPATTSGQVVTPAKAQRVSFVLSCIRILTEDVSALPIIPFLDSPNGPEKDKTHYLHPLLNIAPNHIQTAMEMRERILMDLILYGNFYVMKMLSGRGDKLTGLYPLPASGVTRRTGELVWDFTDAATMMTGTLDSDSMWRGSIMSNNNFDGQAITLLAREAIGLLMAAQEQGARLFAHGIQSDLVLETTNTLDEDARTNLKKSVMSAYSGSRNAFTPLLLEGDLKATRIGLTAQESQYMEARNFQGQEIARIFRIPAVLLGMVGDKSATYASAEQFFQSYVKYTLNPWTVRIEQTIHRDLLQLSERSTVFVKHDFSSLLKGDKAARYSAYKAGIDAGFLSPNDARTDEDLPRVAGLDAYARALPDAPPSAPSAPAKKPADDDQDALANRAALVIFRREVKGLVNGNYKDPAMFYAVHAAFVEDLTGAPLVAVNEYCKMRLATEEKFSPAAQAAAISALIGLCKKGNQRG